MKFLIITHVQHKKNEEKIYGYGPYIKEMNLWLKHVDEVRIVGPMTGKNIDPLDLAYRHERLTFVKVPAFNLTSKLQVFKTLFKLPVLFYRIMKEMAWAEHIHLRCPGNMGLLGSVAQICFPHKMKTAKYAGNWDPHSKQPWSYNVQKWILSNTFLTRNMKVLVYGEWPGQSKNIIPFFTASYSEKEKVKDLSALIEKKLPFSPATNNQKLETNNQQATTIRLLFVGTLSPGKRPLLAVETARKLLAKGNVVQLDIYGEGSERKNIETYIAQYWLQKAVTLHGNRPASELKEAYKRAHFLLFASRSEGWPKVVAEAMWWGCLPVTTAVSCVPYMTGYGSRGRIVEPHSDAMVAAVESFLDDRKGWEEAVKNAVKWSSQFTIEYFRDKIGDILNGFCIYSKQ